MRCLKIEMSGVVLALAAVVASHGTALARDNAIADATKAPPQVYKQLLDCRAIGEPQARLACYDRTAAAMASATDAQDLLIIDRGTVRATKRSLFGLTLPNIKLFGGNDNEEVDQIEGMIRSVYTTRDGAAVFVLADESRWQQTDGSDTFAKAGQPIVVKRASLGGFMAKVNGQAAVRVMRLQVR